MTAVTDAKGNVVTERSKILEECRAFYETLYQSSDNASQYTTEDAEQSYPVLESEIRFALSKMKEGKASGSDELVVDFLKVAEDEVIGPIANVFTRILESQEIPEDWKTGTVILLHKKGDRSNLKNYRPITLLPHLYKLFTKTVCNRITKTLDENQGVEQAGFRKNFSTIDHIHTVRQIIEKSNEYSKPLCLGFIDFEKAFDSVEHKSVFEAIEKQGVDVQYINILKKIYKETNAVIKMEGESKPFQVRKGVRQGDTISPKLFTAVLEEIFRKLEWNERGIRIDGRKLSHLRFADDIVVFARKMEDLETMIRELAEASGRCGLRLNAHKTKIMRNSLTPTRSITVKGAQIDEVEQYVYLGQLVNMTDGTEAEISRRCAQAWQAFGRAKLIFKSNIPICLKRQVFDQCILPVMTYSCETWTTTKKQRSKLEVTQRAMERAMLKITRRDRKKNDWIRERTGVKDVLELAARLKWSWAGHMARRIDDRWTKRVSEWYPRDGVRRRGRQKTRWVDDIRKVAGTNWIREAQDRKRWKRHAEAFVQQWTDTG